MSTIPRLFADYFRPPADYSGCCSATIRRLLCRSFCCPAQVRGCSLVLAISGGAAPGAAEKRSGNVLRRRIGRGMLREVSVTGVLRRILNTLYLRRKCPVFAFYGLRYIRILPGRKNAVYARKWGYFEGVQKFPGNYSGQNAEKAPRQDLPTEGSSSGTVREKGNPGARPGLGLFAASRCADQYQQRH